MDSILAISNEVEGARSRGSAVVALESTIISHGMPYPRNVETALAVEAIVRDGGAIPATIAVMDGKIKVGLSADELDQLGTERDVLKASRRDLGLALAQGVTAATTVAATMIGAHLAGIRLFATGGTGGVHRGATASMDVSADLPELARTPVAVVSAGVKSILDIGRTLEYLETLGVPVFTYGSTEFPAFYSRRSGFSSPGTAGSAEEIARALAAHWQLPAAGGVLIANPIPEKDEIEFARMERTIEKAVADAESQGVHGKEVTPFLLARIVEISDGESLEANIALVKNNARLAAAVARSADDSAGRRVVGFDAEV